MKKSRVFVAAGIALLATGVLAACGSSKSSDSTAPKNYGYVYTADPETLDYLISGKQSTKIATSNGIDGLFTNDKYGNLTPAVAEDWSVSKDGLTYTYKIRKGVKWFTSDGEEYAEVKAKDFVNGLKHAADNKSETWRHYLQFCPTKWRRIAPLRNRRWRQTGKVRNETPGQGRTQHSGKTQKAGQTLQ